MIDIVQWRAVIGNFSHPRSAKCYDKNTYCRGLKGIFTLILLTSLIVLSVNNVSVSAPIVCLFTDDLCYDQPIMATCVSIQQPHVDLLLRQGIESNPGPGIEDVLAELQSFRKDINSQFEALRKETERNFCSLRSDIEGIRNDVTNLQKELDEVKSKVDLHSVDWEATGETIEKFSDRIDRVEEEIERLERYSRRENVMLYGLKEGEDESPRRMKEKVASLLREVAPSKDWKEDDFVRVHRVGKKDGDRPRPVIARCTNHDDKFIILNARERLRTKEVRVGSDLTMNQREELRRLKENEGKRGYFKSGKLFVDESHQHQTSSPSYSQYERRESDGINRGRGHHVRRGASGRRGRRGGTQGQQDPNGPFAWINRKNT